jgi:hypothetical protein
MEHKLMRVSNTRTYGVEPVFALCTCGWSSEPSDRVAMERAFDAHTVAAGAGLVTTPWRAS